MAPPAKDVCRRFCKSPLPFLSVVAVVSRCSYVPEYHLVRHTVQFCLLLCCVGGHTHTQAQVWPVVGKILMVYNHVYKRIRRTACV